MDKALKEIVLERILKNEQHFDEKDLREDKIWPFFDNPVLVLKDCFELNETSEKEDQSLLLAAGILSDLFSVLLLIRQGYVRPPAVILRCSIENLCTLIAITKNEQTYQKYLSNNLDVPKDSVPKARPEFPVLPRFWADLSQKFVHETIESLGRVVGKNGLNIIPDFHNHVGENLQQEEFLLLILPIILDEYVTALEWVFSSRLTMLRAWERIDSSNLKKIHDSRILKILKDFETKTEQSKR